MRASTVWQIVFYVLSFVLVVAGIFFGISLFQSARAESYINGTIDISNRFSQKSFTYSATNVTFYHDLYDDTNTYSYEQDLLQVEGFNGVEKSYKMLFNDQTLLNVNMQAGQINTSVTMQFYSPEGKLLASPELKIQICFLSNKTQLKLVTIGKENAAYLEQYFAENGIRLIVDELLEQEKV